MSFYSSSMNGDSPPAQSEFLNWFAQNIDEIKNGGAIFQGQRVTRESVIARYFACASFLFATTRQISSVMLENSDEARKAKLRSTLVTLFVGWWGLMGIVITPIYLYKNLMGGERFTVADLLEKNSKLESSNSNFEFGPAHLIIAIVALFFVAGLALQCYVQLRKFVH